jgi:hypothetical protein
MFAKTDRKVQFKSPPTVFTDKLISQEARRSKALEEQKRVGEHKSLNPPGNSMLSPISILGTLMMTVTLKMSQR